MCASRRVLAHVQGHCERAGVQKGSQGRVSQGERAELQGKRKAFSMHSCKHGGAVGRAQDLGAAQHGQGCGAEGAEANRLGAVTTAVIVPLL